MSRAVTYVRQNDGRGRLRRHAVSLFQPERGTPLVRRGYHHSSASGPLRVLRPAAIESQRFNSSSTSLSLDSSAPGALPVRLVITLSSARGPGDGQARLSNEVCLTTVRKHRGPGPDPGPRAHSPFPKACMSGSLPLPGSAASATAAPATPADCDIRAACARSCLCRGCLDRPPRLLARRRQSHPVVRPP